MHAVPLKQILERASREAEAKAIGVTKTFALYIMHNKSTKKNWSRDGAVPSRDIVVDVGNACVRVKKPASSCD